MAYSLDRDSNGVPHISAATEIELYEGLGYAHAMDRGLQMLLTRILFQGRACEILADNEEMLGVDLFFRKTHLQAGTKHEVANLTSESVARMKAYCQGVNARFQENIPLELKLVGYRAEPWSLEDCVTMSRMAGYIGLAQTQGDIEKLIIQLVQAGISEDKLQELFPGHLNGLDIPLVKKLQLHERLVPDSIRFESMVPKWMASNNWAVHGSRTHSGSAMMANDPHLEVNRLPNVWYEIVLKTQERYIMGATMPGVPAVLIGRNNDVAWGATYTFLDGIDSWIEHVKDGKFLRKENGQDIWKNFHIRNETIQRKKNPPTEVTFFENDHGLLDWDAEEPSLGPGEKFLLTTRWASDRSGARSLNHMLKMFAVKTVEEAMPLFGGIEVSFNWVLSDRDGNIGYQMSGVLPRRRTGITGLVPLSGWLPENDWHGTIPVEELPRSYNPPEGFIVTANNDLNHLGIAKPINCPMATYRADRITKLLSEKSKITLQDHMNIQYDLYSNEAEKFMKIIRPLLPDTEQGKILKSWNLEYTTDSKGAFLFEKIFEKLFEKVFGNHGLGMDVNKFIREETSIYADFHLNFLNVILAEKSLWYRGKTREQIFREAVTEALKATPQTWGSVQKMMMTNIFFGGKLPKFLGFDYGPIEIPGGRATVSQGQLYKAGGRQTSFLPSIRLVTDMSEDVLHTNIAGGVSDRRFSRFYTNDVSNWINKKYKTLIP